MGTATRRRLKTVAAPAPGLSEEERQDMIARAAYYRAEQRGFAPGNELDDWLAAEADISAQTQPR